MHCDEVIHLQQLSIPWKRPTEPIFSFLSNPNQEGGDQEGEEGVNGDSMVNANNSV
jgi:hypothetical protein